MLLDQRTDYDLETLATKLNRFMPQSDIVLLKLLGEGFSSVVFETAGDQVIKLYKSAGAPHHWLRETMLMGEIRYRVPVPVPEMNMVFDVNVGSLHTAISYTRINGRPLRPDDLFESPDDLVRDLAGFLVALHKCRIRNVLLAEMMSAYEDWDSRMTPLRDAVLPPLKISLKASDYEKVETWWRMFLENPRAKPVNPVLVHGDFWHENIMVDGDPLRLTGALDFEDAHIGDPAQDFATLCHINLAFALDVAESYVAQGGELDPDWRFRMARQWELREFFGVRNAIKANDIAELNDSIRKLRSGPIFHPDQRLDL